MIYSVLRLCQVFAMLLVTGPAPLTTNAQNDAPAPDRVTEPTAAMAQDDEPVQDKPAGPPKELREQPPPQVKLVEPPAAGDVVPVEDPELDELLDKLERSADDLRSFTARIIYRKKDDLLGRQETRTGNIVYVSEPVEDMPNTFIRKFALLFDALVINARRNEQIKHYIFDGRWLAEIDSESKLFQAREIVPPGRVLDPLKLGEGPFPLPIGQPKEDVLKRFIVDWTDRPPTGVLDDLDDAIGIVLLPRSGTEEGREFYRVEVYYDRETLLPVGVDARLKNGDRKTVRLKNITRNNELDADTRSKVSITRPESDDWTVIIEPWEGD